MSDERTGILVILDGLGINPDTRFNAVALAKTPHLQRLFATYSHTQLEASESHVGLPKGFMGNSEVGHLNMGAGRVVFQDFSLISHAIEEGTFFSNPVIVSTMERLLENKKRLHLMGLVSDGGVHSHMSHLLALLELAKKKGLKDVCVHAFTDGRDTSPTSGRDFIANLNSFCRNSGFAEIVTIQGRFYAMDRDERWDRTEQAFTNIVLGQSEAKFSDPVRYIEESYQKNITDEFIRPGVYTRYTGVEEGDAILFFNFRADRARQLTRAITQEDFSFFSRTKPRLSSFVCMTPYGESFALPTAYGKPKVRNTLGEIISQQGWKQLRVAETEKYAHVTYFFNGGDETVFDGEKRILIPSAREIPTYDLKPEMKAKEITDALLKELATAQYRFAVVNFANPDMVGHTGNLPATIRAVEVVDECVGRITDWIESHNAFGMITADHGNCEQMQDEWGKPLTSHTTLPVPFILIDASQKNLRLREGGRLCDIAPTMLNLWRLIIPKEMTGRTLISSIATSKSSPPV